jgi:Arc/MetJ family transcription regulator
MRTNVVIDDALLADAMACTGLKTKKAVIERALQTLIRLRQQEEVRELRGKLRWEGDLDAMRQARLADVDR